jgi:predicted dehydrogenase
MRRLKLGYVGCGFMAQRVHLPNFLSIPECELVAVAEVRRELGAKVQARLHIPRLYATHRELAEDPEIEAAAVSAGFSLQGEIARELLLAGKHVFMEKPMAVSVTQAQEIAQAAESAGRQLMVGYMKRYDAGNEVAKEVIDSARQTGELGQIEYARNHGFCGDWTAGIDVPMDATTEPMPPAPPARTPTWLPQEFVKPYLSYLQQYTHNINLLRWLLDASDKAQVRAVDLNDDGYTGVVVLDMNGVRAVLESGRLSYHAWDEHTQVYFTDGWVKAWAPPLLKKNEPAKVEIYRGGDVQILNYPLPKARWSWSYKREAEAFVHAILSDQPVRSSGQDTLTDVRLFEDIYRIYLKQRGAI